MNREIKFRGKTNDGKWITRSETIIHDGDGVWLSDGCDVVKVIEDTVGQFTGLCDANGREIYEGDITKAPLLDPIFGDILSDAFDNVAISFHNGSFVVAYYEGRHKIYLQDLYNKIEVLGNIHDNPELLKGVEK